MAAGQPGMAGLLQQHAMMAQQGFLEGRDMARAFRLLRSNSLIWHYFVHNYLYGETPPAFDVLFWNSDVTRMPRAMHAFYLREFYLHNKLIQKDGLKLAGHGIDLGRIRQPLYAVGCVEDHIAPWKATFKIVDRLQAPVQYTLSSSGHILGIINPQVEVLRIAGGDLDVVVKLIDVLPEETLIETVRDSDSKKK